MAQFGANMARGIMPRRPGKTGRQERAGSNQQKPGKIAQVNGRNNISWERRKALDVEYVDHQSFCLDFIILAKTIPYVLLRKDTKTDVHNSNSNATASH